jgi:hypothetical protein
MVVSFEVFQVNSRIVVLYRPRPLRLTIQSCTVTCLPKLLLAYEEGLFPHDASSCQVPVWLGEGKQENKKTR